jgi:hypothetical protein
MANALRNSSERYQHNPETLKEIKIKISQFEYMVDRYMLIAHQIAFSDLVDYK